MNISSAQNSIKRTFNTSKKTHDRIHSKFSKYMIRSSQPYKVKP